MTRVLVGAAGCLVFVVGMALSLEQVVLAEPAIVMMNEECGLPGSDELGNMIFGGVGEKTTESEIGGRMTLKCKGTEITNDSGRMQTFEGFPCGITMADGSIVVTQDSQAKVSARGVGTMTCTYEK